VIARLRGRIWEAYPNRLVVDAGGVGYDVRVPLSTFDRLNPVVGAEVDLRTQLVTGRDGAQVLYGFATEEERDVFLLLVERVSGVGPVMAVAVVGGMPVERFKACVVEGDAAALARIKGVGKKTAERIVLELKDKVGLAETWGQQASGEMSTAAADAELALLALGYKQVAARKAVRGVLDEHPGAGPEELIRMALGALR
jgi:Holliday junction DNA helicase RuvA